MLNKPRITGQTSCVAFCYKLVINPFTAVAAIWQFEVITHTAICLTLADKYFKRLNTQCAYPENGTPIGFWLLG